MTAPLRYLPFHLFHLRSSRFHLRGVCSAPALALAMLVLVPAIGAGADGTASLQVKQAWIRWLPANLPAGGYLTVANNGDRPVVLIGAASPDYDSVALHRSLVQAGVSKMVPVSQISIAAHSTLSFAAMGYHFMLMQPKGPVAPGDHVPVTLHFADGGSLAVSFEVRKPDASASGASHGMPDMPGMPAKPH